MKNFDFKELADLVKIHPLKIKNIYIYGSRIYGNHNEESDYDMIMVASSLNEAMEHKIRDLNIHVHTPDKFKRDLFDFDIHNLECIYAPEEAKILERVKYNDANFKINQNSLKYKLMNQSFNSFYKAKMRIKDGDTYIGTKSLFHSLRILMFGIQIQKYDRIMDFSEANPLFNQIMQDEENTSDFSDMDELWMYYKDKYLPVKIKLEKEFNG